jgi:hypothetical protein
MNTFFLLVPSFSPHPLLYERKKVRRRGMEIPAWRSSPREESWMNVSVGLL